MDLPFRPELYPGVNGVLLGSLLYESRLVPRWLPVLGFIGAALLVTAWFASSGRAHWSNKPRRGGHDASDRRLGVFVGRLPYVLGLQTLTNHGRYVTRLIPTCHHLTACSSSYVLGAAGLAA